MNTHNKVTPVVLLIDNGSVRSDATKQLRKLAQELSTAAGTKIHPVSLSHADKIPINLLDGKLAQVFHDFMEECLSQGQRHFIILPLFFSEGRAVTTLITNHLTSLQALHSDFAFHIADVVYPLPYGEPLLADIIYEQIIATAQDYKFPKKNIVLQINNRIVSPLRCWYICKTQ